MPTPRPLVLIVEDAPSIRRFLRPALAAQGLDVAEAATGAEGLALAGARPPDVVLLDLGLPDRDGLEVLRALRERSPVPVIVLTARDREEDKIAGLDAGANDYLTKPFGMGELLARVRVALRPARPAGPAEAGRVETGGLAVDLTARVVTLREKEVHLTPHEFGVLALLARNAGRVVTHQRILREVWGHAGADQGPYVRLYVHQLRTKLEADPARPRLLLSEPGVGYRLRAD